MTAAAEAARKTMRWLLVRSASAQMEGPEAALRNGLRPARMPAAHMRTR